MIFRKQGDEFRWVASHGLLPEYDRIERETSIHPGRGSLIGRVALEERTILIPDAWSDPEYEAKEAARIGNVRSMVGVPLMHDGTVIGAIGLARRTTEPYSEREIQLVTTFADQAVIAIENARLWTETRETLEQQTATAEVLQVINSSPGNLAPVFDAMLANALALCEASFGQLLTFDGVDFRAVAWRGYEPGSSATIPTPGMALYRLVHGEHIVHIRDITADDVYRSGNAVRRRLADEYGGRTAIWVLLKKEAALLGAFVIYRTEVRPFTDKQIAFLQNFAAQAVIAMENARLLDELRSRTRDLEESLEYQTATSEVLKVISRSTFDLNPVLEFVLETTMRLCDNDKGEIFRLDNGVYRLAVHRGQEPNYVAIEEKMKIGPGTDTLVGRTAAARQPVQIIDALADPDYAPKDDARIGRLRTMLGVPLMREGVPIGVICTARSIVQLFTEKQIALTTTFADQAVIAIENTRLFGELRERTYELARSVEELQALGELGQAVSSTLDLGAVLSTILNRSVELAGADAGAIFRYRLAARAFRLFDAVGWEAALVDELRGLSIGEDATAMGESTALRVPLQIADLAARPSNPLRDATVAAGYRSVLIAPLVGANRVFGALVLQRRATGEFTEAVMQLMQTIAAQSVLAIQNARLFNEIANKSEQLAEASRHKSQFLANMSHELRTPLNAILGYTELMVDGIYGRLPEKAAGVLERVQNNGEHLLTLINDVLDLSKIEAGQLTLSLEDYVLADVVRSVASAAEGLANAKGLKFTADVAPGLPTARGDARRLAQVLLNLVGNAVKFTDAGEVAIGAAVENGNFVLTVRDTGPGIALADHAKIFEEFQQGDSSNTRKKGGTGLGLAISKRMVEMQGGSISVESELGHGATFRVVLPIRVEALPEELMGTA